MKRFKKFFKWLSISLIALVVLVIAAAQFFPQLLEMPLILVMNTVPITRFEVRGEEVWMNGEINSKTYDQFTQIIAENPQVTTLVEEIVPGSMDDDTMIKLAYFVREQGLNTRLLSHSQIDSGGVDLFLSGVERSMERGAHIGVHSWSDGAREAADFPKDSPEHEQNRKYIEDMLGDDAFYWFTIYAAPADGIYEMTDAEIEQYGLITQPIQGGPAGALSGTLASKMAAIGNPDSDVVIIYVQGGPVPTLDTQEFAGTFAAVNQADVYLVDVHQTQTLAPHHFTKREISFDEAKVFDTESTQILADVVSHFKNAGKQVYVVGVSFGAFLVQNLLAAQGNVADGYLIVVGRLDMPAEVWQPFSEGRMVGFVDGVTIKPVSADEAGMGGGSEFVDGNMAKLAAGLGHKRYTELLANIDLSNVIYIYGKTDEQVGRLLEAEMTFLESKGTTVLVGEGDHSGTIDSFTSEGLGKLIGLTYMK
ncbi:MAG: hypothetical protein HN335_01100 [Anaerolineae bacterium]|jgi:ABC-type transporter Mla MlaB component|nr:hypothetical protein [Anaerolineae bacterium]MBT6322327.1 hypothetical protein [Anaerolineae bacterium]